MNKQLVGFAEFLAKLVRNDCDPDAFYLIDRDYVDFGVTGTITVMLHSCSVKS